MINFFLALITFIVLLAGTIQGAVAYADYCDGHDNSYNPFDNVYKRCDFEHRKSRYDADVDFIAVVVLSGIGALVWVSNNV